MNCKIPVTAGIFCLVNNRLFPVHQLEIAVSIAIIHDGFPDVLYGY